MPTLPVTGIRFPAFPRGAQFNYYSTITVNYPVPDPNTWTNIRFTIINPAGSNLTIEMADMDVTITTVEAGYQWTVALVIPITNPQSLALTPGVFNAQLDFKTATDSDVLGIGQVEITNPVVALQVP